VSAQVFVTKEGFSNHSSVTLKTWCCSWRGQVKYL